jgi:hypothetical protein
MSQPAHGRDQSSSSVMAWPYVLESVYREIRSPEWAAFEERGDVHLVPAEINPLKQTLVLLNPDTVWPKVRAAAVEHVISQCK